MPISGVHNSYGLHGRGLCSRGLGISLSRERTVCSSVSPQRRLARSSTATPPARRTVDGPMEPLETDGRTGWTLSHKRMDGRTRGRAGGRTDGRVDEVDGGLEGTRWCTH